MRTVIANESQSTTPAPTSETGYSGPTFSSTLKDGREITVREMKGSDLIYMEEELAKFGETKRSFYLIERLNVGAQKISFDDIAELGIQDIKTISELIAKASGVEITEEDPK
jgi:hypothetical protein